MWNSPWSPGFRLSFSALAWRVAWPKFISVLIICVAWFLSFFWNRISLWGQKWPHIHYAVQADLKFRINPCLNLPSAPRWQVCVTVPGTLSYLNQVCPFPHRAKSVLLCALSHDVTASAAADGWAGATGAVAQCIDGISPALVVFECDPFFLCQFLSLSSCFLSGLLPCLVTSPLPIYRL